MHSLTVTYTELITDILTITFEHFARLPHVVQLDADKYTRFSAIIKIK